MKSLTAITIISVAVMIMASAGYYFYNNSINESSYPSYHVDMHLNATNLTSYYPIHVNSNLTGNGTYQQLLTISDPSHYGINANGSNLAFYDGSNQTQLYAWEQTINSTAIQVWVKNYNGSSTIDMRVLPFNKNLFNATGYLGEAPQLSKVFSQFDNGPKVFIDYQGESVLSKMSDLKFNGDGYYVSNATTVNIGLFNNFLNPDCFGELSAMSALNFSNGDANFQFSVDNRYYYLATYNEPSTLTSTSTLYMFSTNIPGVSTNSLTYNFSPKNGQYVVYDIQYKGSKVYSEPMDYSSTFFNATWNNSYISISNVSFEGINLYNNFDEEGLIAYNAYYNTITMPTFTIGSFTNMTDHAVASYLSNSITIPMPNWFNLTLKAYTNYSFTFHYNNTPLYFTYDGLINNTIYTGFLDSNLTLDIHFIALGYSGKTELIVGR